MPMFERELLVCIGKLQTMLIAIVFTALQYAAGLSDREGIRPSVRPSVTA